MACPDVPKTLVEPVVKPRVGLDHAMIYVKDMHVSKEFYLKALTPLGYVLFMDGGEAAVGFSVDGHPDFWMGKAKGDSAGSVLAHLGFSATSHAMVDAFYEAAIAAGGKCNGAPGFRPEYHADYYGAFVHDPDGYNVEAVCHLPPAMLPAKEA